MLFVTGLIYSSASLSGAFAGLLSAGLNRLGGAGGLEGWRWVLIIEGLMTIFVGLCAGIFLPTSLETASFLTEEERLFAARRLQADRPAHAHGEDKLTMHAIAQAIFSVQVSSSQRFACFRPRPCHLYRLALSLIALDASYLCA